MCVCVCVSLCVCACLYIFDLCFSKNLNVDEVFVGLVLIVVGLGLLNQLCVCVYKPLDLQGKTSVWCADSNPAGREEKEWARSAGSTLCVGV